MAAYDSVLAKCIPRRIIESYNHVKKTSHGEEEGSIVH